jgi:oxygen-dependent protoporphyrinogen oxidase
LARLVVVGGGIAGLAAAWSARCAAARAGVTLEVLVLERGSEVGGKARTIVRDGWMVEGGPSGYLGGRPELDALIRAAGLQDAAVPANANAKRRFVYRAGRMHEIKSHPLGFARSGVLSGGGLLRLAAEVLVPRSRGTNDETVWDFAARRLGTEAADRLVSPMTLGVFAGDAHKLSLASAFPKMARLEQEHRSLILGMIARRGRTSAGPLTSLRGGMQSLPRQLAENGGFEVQCGATVGRIARAENGWTIHVENDGDTIEADAVIIATEPWAAAELLRSLHATAADALAAIPCPPVTVVALGFGSKARAQIPDGFGVLIARGEGIRMLGNLWETSLYPGRGPAGGILVRAMFGGAVDASIGELGESEVLELAKREVAQLYGLSAAPVFEQVVRIDRAIPQYEVGHALRVEAVDSAMQSLPGLAVTGFGLRGVAFGDAAADGVRTGESIGRWLANAKLLLVAMLLAIASASALAAQSAPATKKVQGWILEQKITIDSGAGAAATVRSTRMLGSGSKLRLEAAVRNGRAVVSIADTLSHETLILLAERKLASVVHPPKLDFHVEPLSLERRVKDLGPGESIAGLATHRYEVTAKSGSRITSAARTCVLQRSSTEQVWMTTDARAMDAIRGQIRLLSVSIASIEAASAFRRHPIDPPGEAVRAIGSRTVIDASGKRHTVTTTSELVEFYSGPVDAALFEVPPGYLRQAVVMPNNSPMIDAMTRAAAAHAFARMVDSAPPVVGETRTCTTTKEPAKSKP